MPSVVVSSVAVPSVWFAPVSEVEVSVQFAVSVDSTLESLSSVVAPGLGASDEGASEDGAPGPEGAIDVPDVDDAPGVGEPKLEVGTVEGEPGGTLVRPKSEADTFSVLTLGYGDSDAPGGSSLHPNAPYPTPTQTTAKRRGENRRDIGVASVPVATHRGTGYCLARRSPPNGQ